jgi:hypothetical protein
MRACRYVNNFRHTLQRLTCVRDRAVTKSFELVYAVRPPARSVSQRPSAAPVCCG